MEKQVKFILVASIIVIAVLALLAISQISGFTIFNTSSSAISILGKATLDSGEIDCSKLNCDAAAFRTDKSACVLSDCCRWNATAVTTSSVAWHTGACSATRCPAGTAMIKCESRTLSVMTTRIIQKREVCANYTNTCLTKNCPSVSCDAYNTDKAECIATECCRYNQSIAGVPAVGVAAAPNCSAVNCLRYNTTQSSCVGTNCCNWNVSAITIVKLGWHPDIPGAAHCNVSLCPAGSVMTGCEINRSKPIRTYREVCTDTSAACFAKNCSQVSCGVPTSSLSNYTNACTAKNCSAIDCNANKADKNECLATQCCMWDASGISTSNYGWHSDACSATKCPVGTIMTKCEDRTTSAGKEYSEMCTNYTDTCKSIVIGEVGEIPIVEAKVNCSGVNCVIFNRSQTTCLSSECCAWNQTALDSNIYPLGWHTGACMPSKCATFPQYKEFSNCEKRRVWAGFARAFAFREEVREICGDFSGTCKSKTCADVNCKELNTSQATCVATGCCNWDQSAINATAWHTGACSETRCSTGSTMRCESRTITIPRTGTWGVTRITQNREICTDYDKLCVSAGVLAVGVTAPNCSAVNCLLGNTTESSCIGTQCCKWISDAITTTKLDWHIAVASPYCNASLCSAGKTMIQCNTNTTQATTPSGAITTINVYREVCKDTSAACIPVNCSQVSCSLYNQSQLGCVNGECCNWNQNEVTASFLVWHSSACSAARCPGNTILLKCEKKPLGGVPMTYQYREICAQYNNTCTPTTPVPVPCTLNVGQDMVMTDDINCERAGENGVTINVPNVTLDCNGRSIRGNGTGYGILLSSNATIKNCNISGFATGIYISSSRNQISSSRITNNANGIYISQGGNNLIYDNFLQNTVNAHEAAGTLPSSWNTTRICDGITNIIGGSCIGGNFWSDYTGSDIGGGVTISTAGDTIGDTNIPYNASNNILSGGDYLPLVYPSGCVSECTGTQTRCASGTSVQTCGNYDADACLEWSTATSCSSGQVCANGACITQELLCGAAVLSDITLIADLACTNGINVSADNLVIDCSGHVITGSGVGTGINVQNRAGVTIKNCIISGFSTGIIVDYGQNNRVTDCTVRNNAVYGIRVGYQASNANIISNIAEKNGYGIYAIETRGSNFMSNIVRNNTNAGIYLYTGSENNIINSNTVENNAVGLDMYALAAISGNKITNNKFNNTINARATGQNTWNDTKVCGVANNIVGGACFGGNYWSNYAGEDTVGNDKIGDTLTPFNSSGLITGGDSLPLIMTFPAVEICGNTVCAGGETCTSCSQDCGSCGGSVTTPSSGGGRSNTFSPSAADLARGYTKILRIGDRVRFVVGDVSHYLNIDGVIWQPDLARVAQVTIASAPIRTTISLGETEKFDMNADGYYDLSVKVLNTIYNSAELFIQTIHESTAVAPRPTPRPPAEQPALAPEVPAEEIIEEVQPSKITSYLLIAVIALVVVVLAIVLIRVLVKRRGLPMTESPLIMKAKSFVQEARRRGYSNQAIEQMMLDKGWKQEDINKSM